MRILYVGMKYDYGKLEQGYSFEHYNFYNCLVNMGHEIIYFDFMTLLQKYGKGQMNNMLFDAITEYKPDLMFTILFSDQFNPEVIKKISERGDTVTFNWFCDDHWRFDNYSKYWAPCFNWVSTTAKSALPQYADIGYRNVIKTQWACNPFLYKKIDLPLKYDMTFIGQPHGNRRETIKAIKDSGIDVNTWGNGWENGRISQEEMIHIFNQSRINLNLSNSSIACRTNGGLAGRILDPTLKLLKLKNTQGSVQDQTSGISSGKFEQIKGRNFEVPGCGGFLLTNYADDLDSYYEIDKEIVCFDSSKELVEKTKYYLKNEEERKAIALAGYMRTLREHTYVHRFNDIFKQMSLPAHKSYAESQNVAPRTVTEVQ